MYADNNAETPCWNLIKYNLNLQLIHSHKVVDLLLVLYTNLFFIQISYSFLYSYHSVKLALSFIYITTSYTILQTDEGIMFTRTHHIVRKTTLYDMDIDPLRKYAAIGCQDRSIR